jgi:ketosteroid isomerase-like protein
MSQENVDLVHRAIDAFNRRDLEELAELAHEDLELTSVLTAVDASGATYRGPDTWTRYFEAMNQTWEEWRVEDSQVFDAGGDRVACLFRVAGKGKHSGARVTREVGAAYQSGRGRCGGCAPTPSRPRLSRPWVCGSSGADLRRELDVEHVAVAHHVVAPL